MIAGSLIAVALLSVPVRSSADTIPKPDSIRSEAISAPTSSSPRRGGWEFSDTIDARLLPGVIHLAAQDTQPRRRRRAVTYSDWYYRRLQIHRWGSWLELPVFATEYWLRDKLISPDETPASWVKPPHETVAYTLGALFTVNTITGVWNLWDSLQD